MNTALAIAFVGIIIFLAHLFVALFSRTRIPDVFLLIVIGILVGPVFHLATPDHFGHVGPIFAQIALAIILFEGGLETQFLVLKDNWKATLGLVLTAFLTTMLLTGFIIKGVTGLGLNRSLLMGAILGSISPSVVIPMVRSLKMKSGPSLILTLESALSDVLCIVFALGFMEAHQVGRMDARLMLMDVVLSFGLAALAGFACGLIWSTLLNRVRAIHNNIFLTLAWVFFLYGISETAHISGAVTVLVFGMTIGNSAFLRVPRFWRGPIGVPAAFTEREKAFFSEMVFLLKTFFFVYLGLSLRFGDYRLVLLATGLSLLIFGLRIPIVRAVMPKSTSRRDASLMSVMASKGLAAAVLASLPLQKGWEGGEFIRDMTYSIIFISIVLNCALVFFLDRTPFGAMYGRMFSGFAGEEDRHFQASNHEVKETPAKGIPARKAGG